MSTPSRSLSQSLSKDSALYMGSNAGARLLVSSVTSTTITVDSVAELTGTSLYSGSKPGKVEILSCAAGASNQGKTANVTGISGNVLTVSVDFSAILAAGDIIDCVPPLSVRLFLSQGHTLNAKLTNNYDKGLDETFDSTNTPMGVDVDGDIPFFQNVQSGEGFARLLAFGIGSYKTVRSVTDGVTTSGSAVLTSATAAFSSSDVGHPISGTGIPTSTTILTVNSATQVTMSANATATATGVTVTVGVAGTHYYRPIEANDGAFTEMEDATFYSQDGNGVVRQCFYGLFGSRTVLNWPENAASTGTVSVLGNGADREVGGTGKTFPTGANNWVRTDFVCDTGPRITFRSAFVGLGGNFRDALTSATTLKSVKNLTLTIERGPVQDRTLGDPYLAKPEEIEFTVTASGSGILNDDTIFEDSQGGANDAEPGSGSKTETRMVIKAVSPNDPTKTFTIDMPRGIFSTRDPQRPRGRFMENFEFRALATLDNATNCPSTATPILEAKLVSSVTKNLALVV